MAARIELEGASRPMNGAEAAVFLALRGWPPGAIAEKLKGIVGYGTIRNALATARRNGKEVPQFRNTGASIMRLWALDLPAETIADELGLPVKAVKAFMRRVQKEAEL